MQDPLNFSSTSSSTPIMLQEFPNDIPHLTFPDFLEYDLGIN